mmetsp:Transcript_43240/g.130673  ORF Transcript_43240/g.130673 Transcript_43240/m.130673 type:complete len:410 (-) Transcript_43240:72-1301(-)
MLLDDRMPRVHRHGSQGALLRRMVVAGPLPHPHDARGLDLPCRRRGDHWADLRRFGRAHFLYQLFLLQAPHPLHGPGHRGGRRRHRGSSLHDDGRLLRHADRLRLGRGDGAGLRGHILRPEVQPRRGHGQPPGPLRLHFRQLPGLPLGSWRRHQRLPRHILRCLRPLVLQGGRRGQQRFGGCRHQGRFGACHGRRPRDVARQHLLRLFARCHRPRPGAGRTADHERRPGGWQSADVRPRLPPHMHHRLYRRHARVLQRLGLRPMRRARCLFYGCSEDHVLDDDLREYEVHHVGPVAEQRRVIRHPRRRGDRHADHCSRHGRGLRHGGRCSRSDHGFLHRPHGGRGGPRGRQQRGEDAARVLGRRPGAAGAHAPAGPPRVHGEAPGHGVKSLRACPCDPRSCRLDGRRRF